MKFSKDLIISVKEGDTTGFELIIKSCQQPIFVYCYRMLGSMQEAEDAVQEVLIKVYVKMKSYKEDISFSAWVYKIAYNHCVNVIRRKRLFTFVPIYSLIDQIEDENVDRMFETTLNGELNEALSTLKLEDRSIIILRAVEDKSYGEIAFVLNKSQALVRKRYERARKKLEAYLKDEGGKREDEKIAVI